MAPSSSFYDPTARIYPYGLYDGSNFRADGCCVFLATRQYHRSEW